MADRILLFSRNFSHSKSLFATLAEPLKENKSHARVNPQLWKKLFFFICVPTILVGLTAAVLEEHPKRQEFIPYSHLRMRTSKYPWRDGVKTLFHNPHYNPLPNGYEEAH